MFSGPNYFSLFFGGGHTKIVFPKKGSLFFSRVTAQLSEGMSPTIQLVASFQKTPRFIPSFTEHQVLKGNEMEFPPFPGGSGPASRPVPERFLAGLAVGLAVGCPNLTHKFELNFRTGSVWTAEIWGSPVQIRFLARLRISPYIPISPSPDLVIAGDQMDIARFLVSYSHSMEWGMPQQALC